MVRPGNKRLLKARLTKEGAGVNKDGLYFKIGRPVSLKHVFNKNCSSYCNGNNIVGKRNITEQLQFQDNGLELTIQQEQQRVAHNKTRGMVSRFDLFKTSNKRIVNESMKPLPNLKVRATGAATTDELASASGRADIAAEPVKARADPIKSLADIFYELDGAFDIDGETPGGESINITSVSDVNNKLNTLKTKEGVKLSDAEFNAFNPLISQTVKKLKFFDLNGDTIEWTADSISSDAGVFLKAIKNPKNKDFDDKATRKEIDDVGNFILVKTDKTGEFKVSKYSKVYENVKKELVAFKDEIISKKLTITIDNNNNKIEISMELKGDKYELRLKNNSSINKIKLYHFSFKKNDNDKTWDTFTKNQNLPTTALLNNNTEDFSLTIFGGKELDFGKAILLGSVKSDIIVSGFPFEIRDDSADILFNYSDDKGKTWKKGLVPDNNTDMDSKPINASIANYKERTAEENRVINRYIDKIMERFYFGNFYNYSDSGTTPVITMDDFNKAMLYSPDDVVKLQNRLDQRHGNYLKYLLYKITMDKLMKQDTIESERTTPKLKNDYKIKITDDKLNIEFESTNVKKVYVFLTSDDVFKSTSADDKGLSTLIEAVNGKSPSANVLFKSEKQSAKTFKIPIHPNILKAETFSTTANSAGYSIKKSTNLDTIDGFYVGQSDEDKKSKSINLRLIIVAFGTSEAMMHIEKYKSPIPFENKAYTGGIRDFDTNHEKVNKLKLTVVGDLTQEKISAFTDGLNKLKAVRTKLKVLKHYDMGTNQKNKDHSSKITTLDGELTRYNKLLTDWNKAVKLLSEMKDGLDINETIDRNKNIIDTLQNIARDNGAVWQQKLKKLEPLIKGWATDNVLLQKNKWVEVVEALKKKEKDNATKDRANLSTKYPTYFATPSQKPPLPDSDTVQNMHDYIIGLTPAPDAPTTKTIIDKENQFNIEKIVHETIIGGTKFEPPTLDDKFRDHYYVAALNEIKTNYNGGYPTTRILLADFTTGFSSLNAQEKINQQTIFKDWLGKEAYDNIFSKLVPHFNKRFDVASEIGADFNNTHRNALSSYPTTIDTILPTNFDPQPAKLDTLEKLKTNLKQNESKLITLETNYLVDIDGYINNEHDRIVLDKAKRYLDGDTKIKHNSIGQVKSGSNNATINALIATTKFIDYPARQIKRQELKEDKTRYDTLLKTLKDTYPGGKKLKIGNNQYSQVADFDGDGKLEQRDIDVWEDVQKNLNKETGTSKSIWNAVETLYKTLSKDKTFDDTELKKTELDDVKKAIDYWKDLIKKANAKIDKAKTEATAATTQANADLAKLNEKIKLKLDITSPFQLNTDDTQPTITSEIDLTGIGNGTYYKGKPDVKIFKKQVMTTAGDDGAPNEWVDDMMSVYSKKYWKNDQYGIKVKNQHTVQFTAETIDSWIEISQRKEKETYNIYLTVYKMPFTKYNIEINDAATTIIKVGGGDTDVNQWTKSQLEKQQEIKLHSYTGNVKSLNGFGGLVKKIEVNTGVDLKYKIIWNAPTKKVSGRIEITNIISEVNEEKKERIRGGFKLPEFLTRAASTEEFVFGDYDGNKIVDIADDTEFYKALLYNKTKNFKDDKKWNDWLYKNSTLQEGTKKGQLNEVGNGNIRADALDLGKTREKGQGTFMDTWLTNRVKLRFTRYPELDADGNVTGFAKEGNTFKLKIHPLCAYGAALEEWKKANSGPKPVEYENIHTITFRVDTDKKIQFALQKYTDDKANPMGRIFISPTDPAKVPKFFGAKITLNKKLNKDTDFVWKEATSKDEHVAIKDVYLNDTDQKTVIAFVKYTNDKGYDFTGVLGDFEWKDTYIGTKFDSDSTLTVLNNDKATKDKKPYTNQKFDGATAATTAKTAAAASSRVDLVVVDSDKVAVILNSNEDISSFEINVYDDKDNGTQLSESTLTGDKSNDLNEVKRILDNNEIVHPELMPSTSVLKENPEEVSNESFRILATCLSDKSSFSKSVFCGILKVDTPNSEKTPDVDDVKIDFTIV